MTTTPGSLRQLYLGVLWLYTRESWLPHVMDAVAGWVWGGFLICEDFPSAVKVQLELDLHYLIHEPSTVRLQFPFRLLVQITIRWSLECFPFIIGL